MKSLLLSLLAVAACSQASGTNTSAVGGNDAGSSTGSGSGSDAAQFEAVEAVLGAGHVENGVLTIEVPRTDLGEVSAPGGLVLTPAFQLHGTLHFQAQGGPDLMVNGEMALTTDEVQPFITTLIANGLVFEAHHQHTPTTPQQIWFVHFRGVCEPTPLATEVRNALAVTGATIPVQPPQNPTTPLDAQALATILHGTAHVGDEGVVSVLVPRTDTVIVDGMLVKPEAGAGTEIELRPMTGSAAAQTEVAVDYALAGEEINPAVKQGVAKLHWNHGALKNHETLETPQLYFEVNSKIGDAEALAHEIRSVLDLTRSQ
jgi:hypothetical protein